MLKSSFNTHKSFFQDLVRYCKIDTDVTFAFRAEVVYSIIQMDVLSDLALRLNRPKEAERWKCRSESLMQRFLSRMFADGLPVVLRSGSHDIIRNESLLPFICIVLGEKLPETVRKRMTEILAGEKFRSTKGYATESLQSPEYRSDGYWRGPIWAPSTMLLLDGLYRCGEKDLVRDTAARFADMVSASGFAENFDAVTGEGLRDRSYTWTASAFLAMSHEFL